MVEHTLAARSARVPIWAAALGTAIVLGVLGGALGRLATAHTSAPPRLPALHGQVTWTPGSRVAPSSAVHDRPAIVAFLGRGCAPCRAVLHRIVRRLPQAERPAVVIAAPSAAAAYGVAPGRRLVVLVDRHGNERTGYAYPFAPAFVERDLRTLAAER